MANNAPWEDFQSSGASAESVAPWQDFQPQSAATGALASGVEGFNNMIPGGNRLTAAAAAAGNWPIAKLEGLPLSYSDLYNTAREQQQEAAQTHPTANTIGTIGGIVNSLPLFLTTGGGSATPVIGDAANAISKGNAALADWLGGGNLAARVGKGAITGAAFQYPYQVGNAPEGQVGQAATSFPTAGAVVGGALPIAGAAINSLANTIKPFYQSGREAIVGNFLKNQATGDLDNIAANELVPGSKPTLGQATGDYGILSLERGMRNASPVDFANLESANNASRNQALESIAGTPDQLEEAIKNRAAQAQELYPAAFKANPSVQSKTLDRILQTPAGKRALSDAATAMQNDMALMATPDAELAEQARLAGQPISGGVGSGLNLRSWDYIKQSLDDQISAAQRAGENNTARSLINLKNGVLNELDALDATATIPAGRDETGTFTAAMQNPEGGLYKQARGGYAAASKPINQMETLQDIQSKGRMAVPDPQTGYDYLSQAKLSRLFDTRKDELQKVLTPEQYGTLQNIVSDLDRASAQNAPNLRAAGSDTIQNLTTKNIASNILGRKIGESSLVQTALRPLSWIYSLPENKMRDILTQALLNPSYAQQILTQSGKQALPPLLSAVGGETSGQIPRATAPLSDQNMQELQKVQQSLPPQSNAQPAPKPTASTQANDFFAKEAKAESGNNPNAQSKTSSASGLFGFTNRTWADMVRRYGKQAGINLGDKNNPQAQATMARLLAQDNIKSLQTSLGRMPTKPEVYYAHVFGAGGADKLIKAAPDKQAIMLFPRNVIDANHSLFFEKGKPRTVGEVEQILARKVA